MRRSDGGATVGPMSDTTTPSEQPYDASQDPDADPEQLESREPADQPDQAEGENGADDSGGA
ncbi:hypothetical protein ATJ97_2440 [Georgenia soli]|uniref:Uncharacterized protein n=1 Tax=Georgenia soli TaxID=638953 RepID=A0A2A9ENV0_9MICO|nr:hypothetical protein ATJ97_2440 [Georgenia soli]